MINKLLYVQMYSVGETLEVTEQMADKNSLIVVGEASESDDDDDLINQDKEGKKSVTFNGAVVVIDSENDSDDNYNLTAEAFASKCIVSRQCNPRFNSLLHKKLRESNCKLHEDTADQVKSSYRFAIEQLREISSRLLEAQAETQDTQKNLRSSLIAMERIDWALNDLTSISFMPNVNLKL